MSKNNARPSRIAQEQRTVEQMIRLYCRKKEGNKELCPQCLELLEYARVRLSRCPFGEKKNTCRLCPIHCYKPAMKERMREVMRYAGPRMLLYHPAAALRHLWKEYIHQYFSKRFGLPCHAQLKQCTSVKSYPSKEASGSLGTISPSRETYTGRRSPLPFKTKKTPTLHWRHTILRIIS